MDQQQAHKTMHDLLKLMVSKKASDLFIAGHIFKGAAALSLDSDLTKKLGLDKKK